MLFYPYIGYIKKIINELERSKNVSAIEINEFGRRIFIKLARSTKNSQPEKVPLKNIKAAIKLNKAEKLMEKIVEKHPISIRDVLMAKKFYVIVTPTTSKASNIWIQRYILIDDSWHMIVPVRSPASGIFEFLPTSGKANPRFLDPLTKKDAFGTVTTNDNKRFFVKSPVNGIIISFQALNRQTVDKSKIILLLAMKLKNSKKIPSFFYPENGLAPFVPPSHPGVKIFIPRIIPRQSGKAVVINRLVPIIAQEKGKIVYTQKQLDPVNVHYPDLLEHQSFDFVTSNEPLAVIKKNDGTSCCLISPGPAEVGGFQIQNGAEVDPGDIVMFLIEKAV